MTKCVIQFNTILQSRWVYNARQKNFFTIRHSCVLISDQLPYPHKSLYLFLPLSVSFFLRTRGNIIGSHETTTDREQPSLSDQRGLNATTSVWCRMKLSSTGDPMAPFDNGCTVYVVVSNGVTSRLIHSPLLIHPRRGPSPHVQTYYTITDSSTVDNKRFKQTVIQFPTGLHYLWPMRFCCFEKSSSVPCLILAYCSWSVHVGKDSWQPIIIKKQFIAAIIVYSRYTACILRNIRQVIFFTTKPFKRHYITLTTYPNRKFL